jgi:hypothetical protein
VDDLTELGLLEVRRAEERLRRVVLDIGRPDSGGKEDRMAMALARTSAILVWSACHFGRDEDPELTVICT